MNRILDFVKGRRLQGLVPDSMLAGDLNMEGVAVAIVFGLVMIVVGLAPGLWRELVDGVAHGIASFSDALRGMPHYERTAAPTNREREPLLALLGLALVLLGILAFLSA